MIDHKLITQGLEDVAHVVADCPDLAQVIRSVQAEREAMLLVGALNVRALAAVYPIIEHLGAHELARRLMQHVEQGREVFESC